MYPVFCGSALKNKGVQQILDALYLSAEKRREVAIKWLKTGVSDPARLERWAKPMLVVTTKLDATTDRTRLDALRSFCAARGLEFYSISSASGEGVAALVSAMAATLGLPPCLRRGVGTCDPEDWFPGRTR